MAVVGTWNLENLYRPGGDYGPKDQAAYDAKLDALAATVTALAPDLLGVQEVGDPDALADLATRVGGTWHTALSEHPDDRGIRVGFLSRVPLRVLEDTVDFAEGLRPVQTGDWSATTSRMGRGALAVRAEPAPGETLDIAVCHLKSKLLTYPGGRFSPRDEGQRARFGAYALFRRAAEAATVRALADRLLQGHGRERSVAVLGDLNDEASAATTQILLGPPGSEIGTAGEDRPDQGDAARLWNTAPLIPGEQRYSRVHNGRRELIDHILVSRALLDRVEHAYTSTEPPSIGDSPEARRGAPGSDHAPVLIRLRQP